MEFGWNAIAIINTVDNSSVVSYFFCTNEYIFTAGITAVSQQLNDNIFDGMDILKSLSSLSFLNL